MARTRTARRLLLGALLFALLAPGEAAAQEASRGEQPTPGNVEELGGALQEAFQEEEVEAGWFPRLTRKLPPFLSDTKLGFQARTYYWDEHRVNGTRAQAWTLGGAFDYRSGWLKEVFAVGVAVYTSQKLVGKSDRDGTGLLRPGQKGYTVAGQAWAEFRIR
jgi:hypothetical protein